MIANGEMDSVRLLLIVKLTLTFALKTNATENSSKSVIYSTTSSTITTDILNNTTNETSEETLVSATFLSLTTDVANLSTTEQPPTKVMRIQSFDFKTLDQSSGRKLGGIIEVIEGIALTKCAESCTNRANCQTINFNFQLMICELIKQSGDAITKEDGWIHFKTLSWTKTTMPSCERRPCSGRENCMDQTNGDHMCLLTHCDKPPILPGATQTSDNYKLGQTLSYVCEKDVKSEGNPNITCTDTGTWTSTTFQCLCPDPPLISGITLPADRVVGTTIQYKCHYNMRTLSSISPRVDTITCGSNGIWSAKPNVFCECNTPPTKSHAYISSDTGRKIGNYVRYDCTGSKWNGNQYVPYVPNGDHYLYCQTSGWYSYSYFYCS